MLSPRQQPVPLLYQDREIIRLLGITEAEYRKFVREARERCRIDPAAPTAFFGLDPLTASIVVNLVIGLVLTGVSYLLLPNSKQKKPAEVRTRQRDGQDIVNNSNFAPKAGFDGSQNVVELGSTIPVVYAKREQLGSQFYGGIRVNTNLLWSQMRSLGGGQMFRGVFMVGESLIGQLDPKQFAFGNNLIGSYLLASSSNTAGRVSIYFSGDGGRLTSADHAAGRLPAFDDGNAQASGGPDVFAIRGLGGAWTTDFCYSFKPSSQTQFGLYSACGNGLTYRVNPVIRPVSNVFLTRNSEDTMKVNCNDDLQVKVQRNKQQCAFNSRANFLGADRAIVSATQGQTLTYTLSSNTDGNFKFREQGNGPDAEIGCLDAAQAISARLRSYDDALVIGESYKLGTALLTCTDRSSNNFVSDVDRAPTGNGQSVTARFTVVQSGVYTTTAAGGSPSRNDTIKTGTNTSHLFRVAIATFVVDRPAQVLEIGFRHTLGIQFNGLCNFREMLSQAETDNAACEFWEGDIIDSGDVLDVQSYTSGTYTGPEERYSFFTIGYRPAGSGNAFTQIPRAFGSRGLTRQPTYSYIRLEMPSVERWEFQIIPLSGWEVRNGYSSSNLEVLDYRNGQRTITTGGITITFNGAGINRSQSIFKLNQTIPAKAIVETGPPELPYADRDGEASMVDSWGKLAEVFIYEEITSSADRPEHEVVYVNVLTSNPTVPDYRDLATIGVNIRAGTEFTQLPQFSVYVTSGSANTHLFPEVLYDLLTNIRYGTGTLLSPEQIDLPSFNEMAQWTRNRLYFFDGAVLERVNIRSWGVEVARNFLLDLVVRNGRFALQPAVWFDRPEPITGLFTAGNILEGTFEVTYFDTQDRLPPRVSVKWREERASSNPGQSGLFPVLREVAVQEVGTGDGAPFEQIDISDYCTSQTHAIDLAKYVCRTRRLITHTIRFKTLPDQAALDLGRSFKLGLETTTYDQPNNGVITADGTVTSWPPLADGSYPVLLWSGSGNAIQDTTLTISGGKASPAGAVFCVKSAATASIVYRVQSLAFDEEGNLEVTATHFPVEANGYSSIVTNWDNGFVVEGAI